MPLSDPTVQIKFRPDDLQCLFDTTLDLHQRFRQHGHAPDKAYSIFMEEVDEVRRALFESDGDLVEEAVDVVVTLIGILASCGHDWSELHERLWKVISKNGLKTQTTHYLNPVTDKITRRPRCRTENCGGLLELMSNDGIYFDVSLPEGWGFFRCPYCMVGEPFDLRTQK